MLNKEYTHFEDYYRESFLPSYERFKSLIADETSSSKVLYEAASELYKSSCELMRIYLWNNGFFNYTELQYIRNFFRMNLITYGEEWVILGDYIENPSKISAREFIQFVVDNSKIFDEFDNAIRSLTQNE